MKNLILTHSYQHALETPHELPDEFDDRDCPICQKVYSREDTLLDHMKSVHWKTVECSICGNVLSSYSKTPEASLDSLR